uniref:F-box domain-containing protein n=1 Tax=Oryza brachyantha TaxID=4533 RepID=J3MWN9_ORYBR
MATDRWCRRRGRRSDKQNCRAPRRKAAPGPAATTTTVDDVPDHLLEDILLRLGPSSACLVRAAYACRRWHRVVTGEGFLDAFRDRHGERHHVAGHYHTVEAHHDSASAVLPGGGTSVFVPSPSLAGVDGGRFSLDFLPENDDGGDSRWEIADSRGGLLLLTKKKRPYAYHAVDDLRFSFSDLIVCEPLTRRYQGILCPADLRGYSCLGVFLLDGDETGGGGISMSNFRVICGLYDRHRCFVGRANGYLYWGIDHGDGAVLVLDECTTEFSFLTFPESIMESYHHRTFRIIAGADGATRVVRVIANELKVFRQLAGSSSRGGGHDESWVLEKLVRLPEATRGLRGHKERYFQQNGAMIVGQNGAMIVAANTAYVLLTPAVKKWLFSVELETMRAERRHERNKYAGAAYPYELPLLRALQAADAATDDRITGRRRRR